MTYVGNVLTTEIGEVLQASIRGTAWDEHGLQDAVEHVLAAMPGIGYIREHRFAPADRVDFAAWRTGQRALETAKPDSQIAIECKVGGTVAALLRQIDRYLAHDVVAGVVVVTTRFPLLRLPSMLRGKPVRGCLISNLGGT